MEETDLYFYLSSEDSKSKYPNNNAAKFKVDLLKNYNLQGKWVAALVDVSFWNDFNETLEEIYSRICFKILQKKTTLPKRVFSNICIRQIV